MDRDDREQLEASSLGELPVTIRTERGELYRGDRDRPTPGPGGVFRLPTSIVPPVVPRDVFGQNVALPQAQGAPALKEPNPYVVNTTFDALPINAQQFVHDDVVTPQLEPGGDPAILQGFVTFVVPPGTNAILRGIKWQADTIINELAFTVTLIVQGSAHRTYQQLLLGQALQTFFPVYALAGPNQELTLQFDTIEAGPPVGYSPQIRAFLTGQLILDTGRELQYEPANEKPPTPLARR